MQGENEKESEKKRWYFFHFIRASESEINQLQYITGEWVFTTAGSFAPCEIPGSNLNFLGTMKKSRISRQDDPLLSSEAKPLIRVFISSTFRDMMDEREYLLKQVFPRLHRICAERGVEMSEIDLRWGVTEKEARRGKVVEICLREIDKSRPYFIGLLGERYGWAPEKKELPGLGPLWEDFPWVEKDLAEGRSITEMEIQYGVLRSPAMKGQAFFYLRHPSLTPEGRGFREEEGSASASRLKALKKTVLRQKSHPVAEYRSLEALGTSVYEHFRRLLDRDFPARPPLSPLERARRDHAAFALSRTGVYVPVPTLFEKLDGFAEAGGKPLVLVGPPGEGKSALLSNWLVRFRRRRPETFLLYHFAAAGGVADSRDLLVRLCSEMKERFGLEDEIPEAPGKLVDAFPPFPREDPGTLGAPHRRPRRNRGRLRGEPRLAAGNFSLPGPGRPFRFRGEGL